jgi:hypothetical protein
VKFSTNAYRVRRAPSKPATAPPTDLDTLRYKVVSVNDSLNPKIEEGNYIPVIGRFAQAIVKQEIENNRFTIKTNRPLVKVLWQVTGIRHDAYADTYRILVEEDKSAAEQSSYLHPELSGKASSKSVEAAAKPSFRIALWRTRCNNKTSFRINVASSQLDRFAAVKMSVTTL